MTDPVDRRGPPPGIVMAQLTEPRTDERTRIAVFADPHVSTQASGTSKLLDYTEEHLAAAVSDINGRDVDLVLSVGDLTKDGEPWNFDAVDGILSELDAPFRSVPGNHDVPKDDDEHEPLSIEGFAERYAGGSLPFVERVGGVDVIGLDSASGAPGDSHAGFVDDEQIAWLDDALADAETPIVAVHHNMPSMTGQVAAHRDAVGSDVRVPPGIQDADALIETLDAHDAPLVFTGHLHLPSAAREGSVRELMTPTTCSYPQSYLLVDIGPDGTEVRLVQIADHEGVRYAYDERRGDVPITRELTAMAAIRVAQFPLVDERSESPRR